jgi:hypothetical protein
MNCHLQVFLFLIGGMSLVTAFAVLLVCIVLQAEKRFGAPGVIVTMIIAMVSLITAVAWIVPCHESVL